MVQFREDFNAKHFDGFCLAVQVDLSYFAAAAADVPRAARLLRASVWTVHRFASKIVLASMHSGAG